MSWSEKAERAERAGQHSYARVCASRARAERRTLPEALDAAKSPQEFGAVLGGLFAALERAMDAEREADDDQA